MPPSSVPLDIGAGFGEVAVDAGISDACVDPCDSVQRIFSKQNVPSPHMESPSLHVCNVNEQDDSTSDKLVAQ